MPARLVDNHYWNDVIFPLAGADGTTPIPPMARDRVNQVRTAVLDTIANLSPPDWSFVFTHGNTRDPEHPYDRMIANQILWTAERRQAEVLVVRLACREAELTKRLAGPDRALKAKVRDPALATAYAKMIPFDPGHANRLDLDTTDLTPEETAARILGKLAKA
jgi:hypothetical protein